METVTDISNRMKRLTTIFNKRILPDIEREPERQKVSRVAPGAFMVMVKKEVSDHIRSWRFIILFSIIILTCLGSVLSALQGFSDAIKASQGDESFFFLRLFTATDGTLPSFFVFVSFLGPLLGISMGFDAISTEENKNTLSRVMSHPIHRDSIINAKFVSALAVLSVMFFLLGFIVMGMGIIAIGIPPTPEEFLRVICFIILTILYVSFWLNLSIFFSVKFRQPATSALSGIAVWLFLTVFYSIFVSVVAKAAAPSEMASRQQVMKYQQLVFGMQKILPSEMFSDATTTLLVPTIRTLGPLTAEKMYGTLPSALPLGQSLLIVWPQITGLVAASILCFVLSYISFMKREIRSG
jgi:ABC-2 type transport system permease protein